MSPGFLEECARFVQALEGAQHDLLETLRLQRAALVGADADEIARLTAVAGDAARRLQLLSDWRGQLLERSGAAPLRATLSEALLESAAPAAEQLRGRLALVQQRFGEVRREAWLQWVVAQRSSAYHLDLLDLIAHGGAAPPTYGDPHDPPVVRGGAVLDAAA